MNSNNYSYGWVCPKCGRVYSPSTFMCMYCNNYTTTITNVIPNVTPSTLESIIKTTTDIPVTLKGEKDGKE